MSILVTDINQAVGNLRDLQIISKMSSAFSFYKKLKIICKQQSTEFDTLYFSITVLKLMIP